MRHGEYEQRRRALETQFREDVELLRAGYQAKLRALEMLWMASPGEALPPAAASEMLGSSETQQVSETVASPEPPEPPEPSEAAEPAPVMEPESRRGMVREEIEAAFAALPDEFERQDVLRVLGYEPPRATLFRVLNQLVSEGWISIVSYSIGRLSTRYSKLPDLPGSQ